jgi:hypothetical protein
MARWGLIPFWMKEKPKVPHINALRVAPLNVMHCAIQVPPRKARQTATLLTLIDRTRCLAGCFLIEPPVMKNVELEALKADLKRLSARVAALEKLLDRIVRQRPVSERQLKKALKSRSLELDH